MFAKFVDEARKIYSTNLSSVILYGSVARNEAREDSDVDIAILFDSDVEDLYDKILNVVVDIELKHDLVLLVVLIGVDRFNKWNEVLPFYKNIKEEGITLWKAA